jgi:hypothetical protein
MLKAIPLIPLALVWSLLAYACNSTAPHSSETSPPIQAATQSKQNSPPQASQQITGQTIWKGRSGGIEIEWTTEDLFAKSDQQVERIFNSLAKRGYDQFLADISTVDKTKGRSNNCEYRRDFELLSVVGTLISFADNEYVDCGGAHPTTEVRFTTIDLARPDEVFYGEGENAMDIDFRKPGKAVKLIDYFPESDVLNALLADRVIKRALANARISSPPRTLASLSEIFAKNDYVLNETEVSLRPDFLTRFAFHHIEGDMVAVRLNLPSIAFAYRSQQIGLLLPIPSELRQPLALTAIGQEGFFMKEAPPSIRNKVTRFSFATSAPSR